MRVWDSLLLEGPKVLYRVAIALLKVRMWGQSRRHVQHVARRNRSGGDLKVR